MNTTVTNRSTRSNGAVRNSRDARNQALTWAILATLLLAALVWSYAPTLKGLFDDWQADEDYSVGQLVPLAAMYLLWRQRKELRQCAVEPSAWGIVVLLAAQVMRGFGVLFLFESAERYSFLVSVAGVVLLVCGWQVFLRLKWVLLFLVLMIPLPGKVHNFISNPLQSQATMSTTFLLELFGVHVVRQGNVLILDDKLPLAVAEACSGLRMMSAFVVVSAVITFLVRRPVWQKATLLISSVPVAILCNIARLSVTAALYYITGNDEIGKFTHDFAGLAMMPLAVLILSGELWLMNKLVIPETDHSNRPR
jgi:exosortase